MEGLTHFSSTTHKNSIGEYQEYCLLYMKSNNRGHISREERSYEGFWVEEVLILERSWAERGCLILNRHGNSQTYPLYTLNHIWCCPKRRAKQRHYHEAQKPNVFFNKKAAVGKGSGNHNINKHFIDQRWTLCNICNSVVRRPGINRRCHVSVQTL